MTLKLISYVPNHSLPKTDSLSSDVSILHHVTSSVNNFVDNVYTLSDKHFRELQDSGIDQEIISLNFKSLGGESAYEYLLYSDKLPRRNDGRLSDGYLRKYRHLEDGGWWCSGLDPLNNWENMLWGCFKPNTPRLGDKDKLIKYEHPPLTPTRAFFLKVGEKIWEKIAAKYGVGIEGYSQFWEWVIDKNLPITITEGAKKAAALLSSGIVAIGLPGIDSGASKTDLNVKQLRPELEVFATPKRQITICFDQDVKPTTIKNVSRARNQLGRLFRINKCQVNVVGWHYPEKGIDDVLVTYGADAINDIFSNAVDLQYKQVEGFYQLDNISISLNQKYLPKDILNNISNRIIGVRSPKGSGKTEALISLVSRLVFEGKKIYLASHRIQLCQAICKRLNIPYIDDLSKNEYGYGFVIDSFHGGGKCRVDIEGNYHYMTEDYVVIVDECEQVLWHLLSSSTEVKKHRTSIIFQFELLLENANQIYLLDADLSNVSVAYFQSASKADKNDIHIINNDYKEDGYNAHIYSSPVEVVGRCVEDLANNKKVFFCTDSQKFKSKYSTQNLEIYFQNLFPQLKILSIDSGSIADPHHPAYGCIVRINDVVGNYDLILCSPTIGTGISIDIKNHFDAVYGIFHGVQSENAVRQQLLRLRDKVNRHLFISDRGLSVHGDGSSCLEHFLGCNKKLFKEHLNQLKNVGFEVESTEININQNALNAYAKIACRMNYEMKNYKQMIVQNLVKEGSAVDFVDSSQDNALKDDLKKNKEENYQQELQAIASTNIDNMSEEEYEYLKSQKSKTKEHRHKERKYNVAKRYGVDVSPDLLKLDDDGYYPQLRLHYFLSIGNQFLSDKETKKAEKIKEHKTAFIPDVLGGAVLSKVKILELLGIKEIISLSAFTKNHPALLRMQAMIRENLYSLYPYIGYVKPDKTPIPALRQILKMIGLKLKEVGREGTGTRDRIYSVVGLDDGRDVIFKSWYATDLDAVATSTSVTSENLVYINSETSTAENNHPIPTTITHAYDALEGDWKSATLVRSETLLNGTFKALVRFANGLERIFWDRNLLWSAS